MCKRGVVAHCEKAKISLCFMSQAFLLYFSFLGPVMPFISVFIPGPGQLLLYISSGSGGPCSAVYQTDLDGSKAA